MRIFGFTAYGGPEATSVMEVPDPTPGPGQLLVRTTAAGVNPADVKVRNGDRIGTVPVTFPMAMGREAAGTVVAAGDGTEAFEGLGAEFVGAQVFGAAAAGTGAIGEFALLEAAGTALVPESVSPQAATCIPVSIGTAYDALDQLDLPPGAALLVIGAGGGVGSAACALAAGRGVRVVGVASAAKRDVVTGQGAEHVVSGPGWVDRAAAAAGASGSSGSTGSAGSTRSAERAESSAGAYDAVLDLVGEPVLREAVPLLRPEGRVISPAAPGLAAELLGERGGGVTRRRTSEVFARIAALIASGELTPLVSAQVPFADAARAVALVEEGHAAGNVVVTF